MFLHNIHPCAWTDPYTPNSLKCQRHARDSHGQSKVDLGKPTHVYRFACLSLFDALAAQKHFH